MVELNKRKVCIVITTRGNYAKMESVIKFINERNDLELQLVLGGGVLLPKYGEMVRAVEEDNIKIHRKIYFLVDGETPVTMAKSAGMALNEFSTAFEDLKPDTVLVIADRFECLPIAIAASYMNIPIAHVEGGEVSGSIDESIRHAITKLSHIHFPATEEAAERIRRLGEHPEAIHVVGSPSIDLIAEIDFSNYDGFYKLQEQQGTRGVGPIIDLHKPYILVSQHPVTTEYEESLHHAEQTIMAINSLGINTFWIWPNMDAGSEGVSKAIRMYSEKEKPQYVHFIKSLKFDQYAKLMNNAMCLVGNSSSGIREAAFLGVPVVNIGTRQDGRTRCKNVIDVDYDMEEILTAIKKQIDHGRYPQSKLYGDGESGKKITEVLATSNVSLQKRICY